MLSENRAGPTDSRDHLYSKVGLVKLKEGSLIDCNYSLGPAEIFAQATFASIQSRGNFDIFDCVSHQRSTPGVASWAVGFASLKRLDEPWARPHHSLHHSDSCVINAASLSPNSAVTCDPAKGRLSMNGTYMDVVVDALSINTANSLRIHKSLTSFVYKAVESSSSIEQNRSLVTLMQKFYIMHSERLYGVSNCDRL